MRANISVPNRIVTGAFNIRVAFPRPVEGFGLENIRLETVSGDPLRHDKDSFGVAVRRTISCAICRMNGRVSAGFRW